MEQEAARARQQQQYQDAVMQQQLAQQQRTQELFNRLANRPAPSSGGGCLKEGTKILMTTIKYLI